MGAFIDTSMWETLILSPSLRLFGHSHLLGAAFASIHLIHISFLLEFYIESQYRLLFEAAANTKDLFNDCHVYINIIKWLQPWGCSSKM